MDGFPTGRLGSWPSTLVKRLTCSVPSQQVGEELFSEWLVFPNWSPPCSAQLRVFGEGTSGAKCNVLAAGDTDGVHVLEE